jgi:hypothetical protein
MLETILLGITTYFITLPVLVTLCVFGIWCEYSESRGFAVFWALVASVLAFFYFKMSLIDIAIYSGAYLVVGVIWSFYRYKRFIVAKLEQLKTINHQIHQVSDYRPNHMLDTITAWIIIWPFSLIENLCGDIINGIEMLVKKVFKGVYHRIYEGAIKNSSIYESAIKDINSRTNKEN